MSRVLSLCGFFYLFSSLALGSSVVEVGKTQKAVAVSQDEMPWKASDTIVIVRNGSPVAMGHIIRASAQRPEFHRRCRDEFQRRWNLQLSGSLFRSEGKIIRLCRSLLDCRALGSISSQ